jgi:hypothetical protein
LNHCQCTALAAAKYQSSFPFLPPFGHHGKRDLCDKPATARVFHCVVIAGDPIAKRLMGYLELFIIFRLVIALSN